jgi:ketosteroid isomerase-like protein
MISHEVQDAIRDAIASGDLCSLHGYFADDVELGIAMAVGPPVPGARSKRSVIDRLQRLASVPPDHEAPEFVVNGERIVAFWDESFSFRSGLVMRSQCTLVFDIRDGLIARFAIHHDLSPARAAMPERRIERHPRSAGTVANRMQRSQAAGQRSG